MKIKFQPNRATFSTTKANVKSASSAEFVSSVLLLKIWKNSSRNKFSDWNNLSGRSSICIFIILCLLGLPSFLPPLCLCLFVSFIRLLMGQCFPADCLSKTTSAFSVSTAATVTHWNAKCRETPQKVKKIGFPKTSTFCTKRAGPWRVNCITTKKNRGFDGEKRKEVVK